MQTQKYDSENDNADIYRLQIEIGSLELDADATHSIMEEQDDKISAMSSLLRGLSSFNDRFEDMYKQKWGSAHQARPIISIEDRFVLNHQHSGRKTGAFG